MRKYIFTTATIILGIPSGSSAQINLSQQVLGCYGSSDNIGNVLWMSTAGESSIATIYSNGYTLTQGFHQPPGSGIILFDIISNNASCPTASDGSASVVGISGCEPPYAISWSTGGTGPSLDRLFPGAYSVTVASAQCSLTLEFTIGAGPEELCLLRFFNAFSPNGDGTNDTWEIENIWRPEFADNEVEIFNRWGQIVWQGTGYNNVDVVWEGLSSGGEKLPDATYFYLFRVAGSVFKGYIELTR